MKLKTLLSLAWVLPLVPVSASAQTGYRDYSVNQLSSLNPANRKITNNIDFGSYYQWCDRYPLFINQTVNWGDQLFQNMRYAEAKRYIISQLTLLANPNIFPNTQFRPYLFTQVQRSLALVKMLDSLPNGNQVQHDSMVTMVGLGQLDFLLDVFSHPVSQLGANANFGTFDAQYVIPYTRDCRGNQAACRTAQRQAQRQIIQAQLVNLARAQLQAAQAYSSSDSSVIIPGGPYGGLNVYDSSVPIVSSDVYFNIITNVALWTATDLSYLGFSLEFSCVITELLNLRSEAHMAQSLFGDREGYRYIHSKVDTLIDSLSAGIYGCGQIVYGVQAPNASTYDVDGSGDGDFFNPYDYYKDGDNLAPTKKQNRKVKHAVNKHNRQLKREERKEQRND